MSEGTPVTRTARWRIFPGVAVSPWIFVDALLWFMMLVVVLWMRFDFSSDRLQETLLTSSFYVVAAGLIVVSSVAGYLTGLYRGRFLPGSLLEISTLATVFAASTIVIFFVHIVGGEYEHVPRSTAVFTGAFTTLSALAVRSLARRKELFGAGVATNAEPAIIYGAGDGGVQLVRQLRRSAVSNFKPIGLLDDDINKHNMLVDGVRVWGGREKIESLAKRTSAGTLIIAIPSLAGDELIEIRDRAESVGLHVLVLPPLDSMIRGRNAVDELREINVNDLLGRSPARLNQTQIADYLRGKRILVTGAGGSIGSELCRQVSRFRPAELMMLDRDETGLHAVQLSIKDQAMLDGDDTILASIRDRDAVVEILRERKPQIVFHAAALKHMPLLEQYPLEALKTNVLGTLNMLEAAKIAGVETFVNISTDKAANPCSVLGTSKRVAERLTAGYAVSDRGAKYVSVRFGNVLGSRGSVLTVFEKQIKNGGPVTVTDPEVTRFFMTIPEACQLVLQAAVVGETGKTLVLDMGESVKIAEVAKTLVEQSGQEVEIIFTGLRKNEKLAEELFDDSENPVVGKKHEALSEVDVPPLMLPHDGIKNCGTHDDAIDWLERYAHHR